MNECQISFASILTPYQMRIEELLKESIAKLGFPSSLQECCQYALLTGGKRYRPALVFMIAEALGHGADVSHAALAIEFCHTASLLADDLPCMDNDQLRRNKPTAHLVYGESVALLASYAFISMAYEQLIKNGEQIKLSGLPFASQGDRLSLLAIENVAANTGILGLTGGQFLDLTLKNPSQAALKEVIHKKTVTLFEISFVLGWLFGGGNLDQLPLVKKSAHHFGMAFQIADDIDDIRQDGERGHVINLASLIGLDEAKKTFYQELDFFKETLTLLNLSGGDLNSLAKLLRSSVS
jgi:geranylgeranyl diphosphate synthase, type II